MFNLAAFFVSFLFTSFYAHIPKHGHWHIGLAVRMHTSPSVLRQNRNAVQNIKIDCGKRRVQGFDERLIFLSSLPGCSGPQWPMLHLDVHLMMLTNSPGKKRIKERKGLGNAKGVCVYQHDIKFEGEMRLTVRYTRAPENESKAQYSICSKPCFPCIRMQTMDVTFCGLLDCAHQRTSTFLLLTLVVLLCHLFMSRVKNDTHVHPQQPLLPTTFRSLRQLLFFSTHWRPLRSTQLPFWAQHLSPPAQTHQSNWKQNSESFLCLLPCYWVPPTFFFCILIAVFFFNGTSGQSTNKWTFLFIFFVYVA